jgi:hypothetical protein
MIDVKPQTGVTTPTVAPTQEVMSTSSSTPIVAKPPHDPIQLPQSPQSPQPPLGHPTPPPAPKPVPEPPPAKIEPQTHQIVPPQVGPEPTLASETRPPQPLQRPNAPPAPTHIPPATLKPTSEIEAENEVEADKPPVIQKVVAPLIATPPAGSTPTPIEAKKLTVVEPVKAAAPVTPDTTLEIGSAKQSPADVQSRSQMLSQLLEKFVKVENVLGSHFTHRGYCLKCGWQSFQLSASDALTLVRNHVQQHWRDVSAQLEATVPPVTPAAPAPHKS